MFCIVEFQFECFEYYPYTQMWQYNVPTKCELHIPYGLRDIPKTRFYRSRSLQEGQRLNQGRTMMLHTQPQTSVPTKYQLPTPYGYGQGHYDKIKSRSHHDVAHLQPLTNVSPKYQLPARCDFKDITRTRFYRSRSLQQGQRSNQGHTMTLHTYTP